MWRFARPESRIRKKTITDQNGGGTEAEVNRVKWDFTNGTGFFRSFRLEQEKRNTSEDFHLFRKLSAGMNCTI